MKTEQPTIAVRSGRVALCLLACWLGPAAVALAGPPVEDDASNAVLETGYFETATVQARAVAAAAASVTVIDREKIEELGMWTVAELLRFAPGVDVTPSGPRGGFVTAQIRGGDPNYTTVMLDGVPLNDVTDQVGGAVNLNSLSTAHVERIEIVRGPLSSNLGSTGLAGAINIITRTGGVDGSRAGFAAAGGSHSVISTSVHTSNGDDDKNYFIGAGWEREEDAVIEDEFDQVSLHGNTRWTLGGTELRLTGRVSDWEAEDYPEASGGPINLCPPNTAQCETRMSEHQEVSFGVNLRVGNVDRRHRIHVNGYRHELDRVSPAVPPVLPAAIEDTVYTRWRLGWNMPERQYGSARINFGVGVEVEDGESNSDLGFPAAYRLDRATGGAFFEFINVRGPLTFEAGVRVDVPEDVDNEVSPRLGLLIRPGAGATRIRVSAGRAFKLPSFFALATPIVGNPNLSPETSVGADAGVEHTFESCGLTAGLTLFYNRFEDLITFDGMAFTHVNVPEAESRGAELAIDWTGDRLNASANLTRQEFDTVGFADPLTNRPEWIGAVSFVWRITRAARIEIDGQWVGQSFDFQATVGTAATAGYQLYGAAFSVNVARRWQLHARADNLADKDYQPHIGFPGVGRSVRVGVRYR